MHIHRFIVDFKIHSGSIEIRDKDFFHQIRNVLKLRRSERIALCSGNKEEGIAEIKNYGKGSVELDIIDIGVNQNEPEKEVILFCSILKKENFELVIQKATEIGIKKIVPIITERTVKLNIRQNRLEKIIKEAGEQSGRGILPVLVEPIEFEKAVYGAGNINIFFDISGEKIEISRIFKDNKSIGIWIGPEGGWTNQELELAKSSDFKVLNLGKLTLRAETAAIVGSYFIIHNF